jgi:hypothetical protein
MEEYMAHLCRNCHQAAEGPGKYCSVCLAHKNLYYRLQLALASVIGVLALLLAVFASPQPELLLKPIEAPAIAVFDELVVSEVCEMIHGESARDCCARRNGKNFKKRGCAERQLNNAKDLITSLIRKGANKIQASLS